MIWIGTCGWQYPSWRNTFYPAGVPQRQWLEFYASHFATLELDSAFYRLPEKATFEGWRRRLPSGFVVAVKMSRYLTHVRRLRDPAEPVTRFLDHAAGLGPMLGPVLLQLPPSLAVDPAALDAALACFPPEVKVVVEPRHPSWWIDSVRRILIARNAALCWSDRLGRPVGPSWQTADFGYLRMHEGRGTPAPHYGVQALDSWLRRIAGAFDSASDVYVYFNNDTDGAAVADARTLLRRAGQLGQRGQPTG